jgi:hypothetical protein
MKHLVRFVTNWRMELTLAATILSLGTTSHAQWAGATWCSDEPVYTYQPEANLCMGEAGDCYSCVVWLRE